MTLERQTVGTGRGDSGQGRAAPSERVGTRNSAPLLPELGPGAAFWQAVLEAEAKAAALLAPPPKLKVSEWAELNRELPKGASARPGLWRTESYQREMMDAVLEPNVREVVYVKSAQMGGSEILNNIVGYFIAADPRPMMMVQPTEHTGQAYSKKRIAPMIAASAALRAKVREPSARRAGNTIQLKEFDGGFLKITGANSGAGLRSDPIAVLLFDEVDGYPDDVDGEGDPVEIATRRTDTFADAKVVKVSTPGKVRGLSRIEADWNRSDQREYHVPCPHCGDMQPLLWRDANGVHRLVWEQDENRQVIPESVRYLCTACGALIEEKHKRRMLEAGRWVAAHPERRTIAGFRINALYSPWRQNWPELAQEWIEAQDNPEKLRVFVNLRLAETWDEGATSVLDAHVLAARLEKYPEGKLPDKVAVLVAAADVQHNRIEVQITGFGPGEESWLIAHEIFWGNPGVDVDPDTEANVWQQLDDFLLKRWPHPSGVELTPAVTLIDAGAHADSVYDYVLPRQHTTRRILACKGVEYLSKPGLVAEGTTKRSHVRLFLVGTYAAKDRIFARLKIPAPGPGFMHLPDCVTDEYLEQLTGEKKIITRHKRTRRTRTTYVKSYARNEALDLTVYCYAALAVLQYHVAPRYQRLSEIHAGLGKPKQAKPARAAEPRLSNFVTGWRG